MEPHPDIGGSCDDSGSGNAAHLHPQAEAMSRNSMMNLVSSCVCVSCHTMLKPQCLDV